MPAGADDEDRREDQQRDAVADAALGDQLAHPHQERRPGGERDHDQDEPADVGVQRALALEEVRVAAVPWAAARATTVR